MNKPTDEIFLKANAASLRALAGGTQHEVRYVGQDSLISNDAVRLPAPPSEHSTNSENQLRGASVQLVYGLHITIRKPIKELVQNHLLPK